jgi:putative protease
MRSPEYVAIVVSIYKKALDSISRGKWKPKKDDIDNLKLAFNRDFTGGYVLEDNCSNVMGRNRPGNRGIYLGSLKKYDKNTKKALVKIEGDIFPQKGDGIVFISKNKDQKEYGMSVNESPQIKKDTVKFKVQRHLNVGTSLYLTKRKVLVDTAQKIISGSESELKKSIPVDLDILIQNDGTIFLKSIFNGAYGSLKLEMVADFKMERAINRPLDEKIIVKQFKRTGNTPFKVKNMNINYPGDLFAPVGELNRIRREMFEKIEEKIISSYIPSEDKVETSYGQLKALYKEFYFNNIELNESPDLCAYVDDLEVLRSTVKCGCNKVYFNPFNFYNPVNCNSKTEFKVDEFLGLINEALSVCKENGVEFVLKLPKITSSYFLDNLKPILTHVFKAGVDGIMVDGIGAAKFIFDLNPKVNLFASSGLNIWNFESINVLQCYFKSFTISPELSEDEIRNFISKSRQREINVALELIVQGNLESLISKDCLPCLIRDEFLKREMPDKLFLGIKDVKGRVFPLRLDNECRTNILNSVELSLIDYMPQIMKMGVDAVLIDLEGRTGKYAEIMCSVYKDVIEMDLSARNNNLKRMKGKVKRISIGGITTGNFLRGTIGR